MIKKNIYTIILAALLAMSFVGCTSQKKATESNTETISADQSNTESKTASSDTDQSNTESKTASSTDQLNTESKTASSSTDQPNTESKTASSSNTRQSNTESKTASSSNTKQSNRESKTASSSNTNQSNTVSSSNTNKSNTQSGDSSVGKLHNLSLHFGPNGPGYSITLDNYNTAAEIARYVGQEDWNLPIYHFDDFDNSNVMQYYDIPSRYKISSAPEKITSEKAGDVYYSAPNRIIIFYQDAKVTGDFTKVGRLQSTDGLDAAVKNNPVVEGWGNKIITISPMK